MDGQAFRIHGTIPVIPKLALPSELASRHEMLIRREDWLVAGSPPLLRFLIDHHAQPEISLKLSDSTSNTREDQTRVPSTATAVAKPLSITPRRLNFGIVPAGNSVTRTVVLTGAGQLPGCDPIILSGSAGLSVEMTRWRRQDADLVLDLTLKTGAPAAARLREELMIQYGDSVGTITVYAHPR